ncbi:MAG: ABC transporter ATP-binding protein [Deltaproteobacteria bacterium]|nr:ABC transporter ATP-binding protein [Deltaproteobacteria bacterium]
MIKSVTCQNVCKSYLQGPNEVKALVDINLNIEGGEFISLCGPSGSGKTTLLNLLGGLDISSSGEIRIAGRLLNHMSQAELARLRLHSIGFVFQSYNLLPVLSACENVEFIMQLQGIRAKERRERAMLVLREVGLSGLEDRRPGELSGGQQQRVAIARAIVTFPSLILADEPTANLDSKTAAELMDMMLELNEEHSITFIFSTHDQLVMNYAKRLIRLHDGKIVSDDTRK